MVKILEELIDTGDLEKGEKIYAAYVMKDKLDAQNNPIRSKELVQKTTKKEYETQLEGQIKNIASSLKQKAYLEEVIVEINAK